MNEAEDKKTENQGEQTYSKHYQALSFIFEASNCLYLVGRGRLANLY